MNKYSLALILMIVILIISFIVLGITQSNYHQCLELIEDGVADYCSENLAAPLVPMFIGFVGILGVIAWNPTHFNLVKVGN
jgi:hypothetical protein